MSAKALVPPPKTSFSGSFDAFYKAHIEPNLPSPRAIAHIHKMLKEYLNDEANGLYVIRKFEGRVRGRQYIGTHGTTFVCGDNEPALWFYARAFLEDFHERLPSLASAISNRSFPIGFAQKETENSDDWSNWGRKPWEQKFGKTRLYHAHLFDAAKNLRTSEVGAHELAIRMIRFLHPANHFPMPTHLRDDHFTSNGGRTDLSELPGIKRAIANAFADRNREIWDEFLALANGDPSTFVHVDNLQFSCARQSGQARSERPTRRVFTQAIPQTADRRQGDSHASQPGRNVIRLKYANFYVTEANYQELTRRPADLILEVGGGGGQAPHPTGTYVIPHRVALTFIESKRSQGHWRDYRCFSSRVVPTALREFFTPALDR